MAFRLRQDWCQKIETDAHSSHSVDFTSAIHQAIQYVILQLSSAGRPFKLYNLGAGVKRVTTDTDICPCCKRKFEEVK